jgi:hypothetical protein
MVNCPLKDSKFNGNCEGCNNRAYCMLSEIMEKLHTLEATIARMEARQAN